MVVEDADPKAVTLHHNASFYANSKLYICLLMNNVSPVITDAIPYNVLFTDHSIESFLFISSYGFFFSIHGTVTDHSHLLFTHQLIFIISLDLLM